MQEYFNELITTKINPFMKNNGYKKYGLSYYTYINNFVLLINIQKSQGNTSDVVRFYINCGIYFKNIEMKLGNNILEKPKTYNCHYQKRIEQITRSNTQWYEISKNSNMELLTKILLNEINSVIGFYKQIKTEDDFLSLIINSNGLNNYEKIFKYLKYSNKTEHISEYRNNIEELLKNDHRKGFFMNKINEIIK